MGSDDMSDPPKDYVLIVHDEPFPPRKRTKTRRSQWIASVLVICILLQSLRFIPGFIARIHSSTSAISLSDPADSFVDDTWPIRQPTPWDISTNYPYSGTIEFDTEEGTWLRLDVHPESGEIVFDMLGDLYCLPAKAYNDLSSRHESTRPTHAYAFLRGVPHDSDPHFSPDGKTLVFRSDAELGVENIWAIEWKGCWNMDLSGRAEVQAEHRLMRNELKFASRFAERDDALLAIGVKESAERRRRRLVREGRIDAWRVTNETYRWLSDPRFHPSGSKIIATKWYTSSRSLGAGEGWVYDIPVRSDKKKIAVGAGERLIGRNLPLGWTAEDYGDQQIGPEQFVWWGDDAVIYGKNVADSDGTFQYSKDVHYGIYAIFSYNLTTKATSTLVSPTPGGASRPEISRDGRSLAFVRRVRDKEALVLKDLQTGTLHHIWYGLTYDLTTVSAPMGTYPSFSFTPSSQAIIIWAAGKIWHVPLSTNALGERVAGGDPHIIPFRAEVLKKKADTVRSQRDLVVLEASDAQSLNAFRNLRADDEGKRVVFDGAGVSYYLDVDWRESTQGDGSGQGLLFPKKVPVLYPDQAYYSPSFIPGWSDLVIHARWSDTTYSAFEIADLKNDKAYDISEGLPIGRYLHPTICACTGDKRQTIAFVKTGGTLLTGNHIATAHPGLYIGYVPRIKSEQDNIKIEDLHFVPSEIDYSDIISLQFIDEDKRLLVQQSSRSFVIELAKGPDKLGNYKHKTLAQGKMSQEIAVTLQDAGDKKIKVDKIAFVDFFFVYIVNATTTGGVPVWSKPGSAPEGLARVSLDGGHGITWTRSGNRLYWLLGPHLHSLEVSRLQKCAGEIAADKERFGIACVRKELDHGQIYVTFETDISRLKRDARLAAETRLNSTSRAPAERDDTVLKKLMNADVFVITNATLLRMETRAVERDLVKGGTMVLSGGKIASVGPMAAVDIPDGATVFDARGGYVVPGFIDVHAHWGGMGESFPARSWELETFLAYGITTLHNPSSDNNLGFVERGRVESGGMVGPRIFHTGDVIYGAGAPGIHNDVADLEDANSALTRIRVEGGYASFSYKNYNQYSRASRQRLLTAAKQQGMSCYPEGGMNFDWDITYIIDGMTTVEHCLPIPTLYNDVLYLYARSGTGATPTHIVNYGGAWGEQLVWAFMDVPNNPKLRRFTRHDILETLSETPIRPANSYALFNTSESIAKMVGEGLRAHIGAHGEPPLGLNYHAEMSFTAAGGLSNFEVYRAATIDAAYTLGLANSIGSLSSGKLADFVVYPPGVDILKEGIAASTNIKYVSKGGRIWNAESMVEHWPIEGRRLVMPSINAD